MMYLLDEQHRRVVNNTARSVALLLALPIEQRRAAVRRVASALRKEDIGGLQHSQGFAGLTREQWNPLVGLKEWRFKTRQQYIFLAHALTRAEKRDMLHLRRSTCRGGLRFLSAYLRHWYASWIQLYGIFTIETHRSAEQDVLPSSAVSDLLEHWKAAMLKFVAYDDVWPKPLYSDTLVALYALYLMLFVRLEKNRLERRRKEVVLDLVLLWKEKKEERARRG